MARCSRRPGILAASFLLGYSAFRFLVEFTREPDAHLGLTLGLSRGQYLCLAMGAVGLATLVRIRGTGGDGMEMSGARRFNEHPPRGRAVRSPEDSGS